MPIFWEWESNVNELNLNLVKIVILLRLIHTQQRSLFTSGTIMTAALSSLEAGSHLIFAAKTDFQSHISGSWCQILSLIQKVDF